MKLKKIQKALVIATAMSIGTISASAATFGDLQGYRWAEKYIEDTSNKGLINGYPDGTFRPSAPVTRIESLIMISNLYKKEDIKENHEKNLSKYKKMLDKYNIEEWSRPYIVFALEKGIIPNKDGMISALIVPETRSQKPAMRYEVAVFLVRGLGLEKDLNSKATVNYVDVSSIDKQAIPYIELLQRKGIISKEGDGSNRFNPKNTINRAEVAVMISNAYKYSAKAKATSNLPTNTTTPTKPIDNTGSQTLSGKLNLFTMSGDDVNVSITLDNGKVQNYTANRKELSVTVGDVIKTINDIKVGQKLQITLLNGKLTEIKIPLETKSISGQLKDYSTDSKTISIESDNVVKVFKYDDNTKIYVNDTLTSVKDLPKNVKIDAYYDGDLITKASLNITKSDQAGEIVDYSNTSITINTAKDGKITKELSKDVKIYRNDKRVDGISNVAIGDEAKLTMDGNKVVEISIQVKANKYIGAVIKSIQINTNYNKILITDRDRNDHFLTVGNETRIIVKNKKVNIYDLKLGYEIDVYTQGGLVDEIISRGEYKHTTVNGVVTNVDLVDKFIEIKQNDGKIYKLYYNIDTKIEQLSNSNIIEARKIFKGDSVTGIGIMNGGNINATRIIADIR